MVPSEIGGSVRFDPRCGGFPNPREPFSLFHCHARAGHGISLGDEIAAEILKRTDGVSAAFIKELMRRIAQFALERNGDEQITHQDVDGALDEMIFKGGSLNLSIWGQAKEWQRVGEQQR